jgi:hypothetical protein
LYAADTPPLTAPPLEELPPDGAAEPLFPLLLFELLQAARARLAAATTAIAAADLL